MTTPFRILYVCNGDNARSPLAAACTRSLTFPNKDGFIWAVESAGIETVEGSTARSEADRAATVIDLSLSSHRPSRLTPARCDSPDLILAMSWEQVSHIWSLVPRAWEKVFTMKEFVHWAKQAPSRPPILFADRGEAMRDKVMQTHAVRKRARADHGFWGGIRPQDLNLIEPNGKGDEAWTALAKAVHALTSDVITLLRGPEIVSTERSASHKAPRLKTGGKGTKAVAKSSAKSGAKSGARSASKTRAKAKAPR